MTQVPSKRERLTEAAMQLFLKYGFRRVSVEEICDTSGVSKMTFYKYFSNKTDLLKQLLDAIAEKQVRRYQEIMSRECPYSQKIVEIIHMKQEQAEILGKELFRDLYKNAPPDITQYLHELGMRHFKAIRNDFIGAQKQGHVRSDVNPDFIMYMMNHMIDMVSDPKLLEMYAGSGELINELVRFFFYGILTAGEAPA
ncbi:TetR/AcrR family transcriptional regulator [bacterium]|nr:TetR/AcrR family transcriptional regulator [bacterium]